MLFGSSNWPHHRPREEPTLLRASQKSLEKPDVENTGTGNICENISKICGSNGHALAQIHRQPRRTQFACINHRQQWQVWLWRRR